MVRNPAWVRITGTTFTCMSQGVSMSLPTSPETWTDTYNASTRGGSIKPPPDVEGVTLGYGGDWGLAKTISATIRCYTIGDFKQVQKFFLIPGNEIAVSFGHAKSWGVDQQTISFGGYKVATFQFNTTDEGFWICSFTAVAMSTALKNLDMQMVVCNGCQPLAGIGPPGGGGYLRYMTPDKSTHPVKGIAQLVACDAQWNGLTSIDDLEDGEVITTLLDYKPGTSNQAAAIVVYNGDHVRTEWEEFKAWVGGIVKSKFGYGKSEVEAANNQVYVTLGYVVNRIINDQLMRSMTCEVIIDGERKKFNRIKIEFDPVYSKCVVAAEITSGDPTSVLFLGDANYMNDAGQGKDFDGDCKNLGAVRAKSGNDVTMENILLHRDVVVAAFNEATMKREAAADNADVKDVSEQVVNVINFFTKVADHIASATGGAINLRIIEHPDPEKNHVLIVVDQNYGVTDELPCVVFNPIDGDGSTRSCEVQSNVGSQEYKAAMFVGNSKNGDTLAALRGCANKLPQKRGEEHSKAIADKRSIIKSPGTLGKNNFNGQEINALKSVMTRLNRNNPLADQNETIHYPGLSMSITLDGVFGFEPGMAISSTQVPVEWREFKSYFMITKVTHTFQNSDWATQIDGILAYYPGVTFKKLN
jgi:hypothetical protein